MLFLGLADGYLKLRFGGLAVTGLRDVLALLDLRGRADAPRAEQASRSSGRRWTASWWSRGSRSCSCNSPIPRTARSTHSLLASALAHRVGSALLLRLRRAAYASGRLFGFLTIILAITAVNGAVSLYQYRGRPGGDRWRGDRDTPRLIYGAERYLGAHIRGQQRRATTPPSGTRVGYGIWWCASRVWRGPAAFVFLMLGRRRRLNAGRWVRSCRAGVDRRAS